MNHNLRMDTPMVRTEGKLNVLNPIDRFNI